MGYYLLVIGIAISAFAVWAMFKLLKLPMMGVRARGVIVGVDPQLRYGGSQRKKVYFHPVIEFETADGRAFRFTFGSGSTRKRPVIGDQITVIYDINHPDKATLNSFLGLWAGPLAVALLGSGTLYGGVQMVFFAVP
jgi:hypothetical protein